MSESDDFEWLPRPEDLEPEERAHVQAWLEHMAAPLLFERVGEQADGESVTFEVRASEG